jgi:serine/threonine protein kinase
MPALATCDLYLDCVRKSKLIDPARLEGVLAPLRQAGRLPESPSRLAQLLVREGLLTNFQAEQILRGRYKAFFISGKYKVLARLGVGGMGTVFLCEHVQMRRKVAVKVLPKDKAEDPAALARFQREARAAATLNHPNIVRAHDVGREGKLHFLVMEYVDGGSFQEIVTRCGPLSVERAVHYIAQVAAGLQHAYKAGLIHRDVKPGNILLDRAGVVKILDMGLARFSLDETDDLTRRHQGGSVLGTADYLAPEQAMDSHNVDIRADIYSMGFTLYFLLTGTTPFGETKSIAQKLIWHQTREPRPVRELRADVPEGLADVAARMMEKDPRRRYQTPADVIAALKPWTSPKLPPPSADEIRSEKTSGARGADSTLGSRASASTSDAAPPPDPGSSVLGPGLSGAMSPSSILAPASSASPRPSSVRRSRPISVAWLSALTLAVIGFGVTAGWLLCAVLR